MAGLYGQFLGTVGVEFEGIGLERNAMQGTVLNFLANCMGKRYAKISLTRDASTEFIAEYTKVQNRSLLISTHTESSRNLSGRGGGKQLIMGYEFITHPVEIFELESILYPLVYGLYRYGDFLSHRAAIHFHVGYVNNFRMLKNLLNIMLELEPVLFRLGGMGETYRGFMNNSAYARPLLSSTVVPVGDKLGSMRSKPRHAHIINALAARDSASLQEFWACFGIDSNQSSLHKYHPSRYSGANFFAIPAHGTFEFRYFNQSHDVPLVMALAKFLRAIVEMSTQIGKREFMEFDVVPSNVEISMSDASEIVSKMLTLCRAKDIDDIPTDNEMSIIMETLEKSHFVPIPETPTKTHIKDFNIPIGVFEMGKLVEVETFLPPNYVDVHNIAGKNISIFE